jgi:hypothetical protein
VKNLDLLIPKPKPLTDRFTWATVASVDPIRVQLDGETVPLDITPDCLVDVGWLDAGRRVWCQVYGRRVLILGQAGKTTQDHDQHTYPTVDGWIASETQGGEGWTFSGDGSTDVRTPTAPEEIANKEYVDTAVDTSLLTDFGLFWRTSSFSTPDGWADLPSPTGTDSDGAVTWDGGYNGFIISKPGIYLVTANLAWNNFGSAYRRDLIIRREDASGSGSELARHGTESGGRVSCSVSTLDVVTQSAIDSDGVRFRSRIYQGTGSSTTADGPLRVRVARVS